MNRFNRMTLISTFFILLIIPTLATAIPVTYQFDAFDWYDPQKTFTGSITFESSTAGVQTSPASDPSYPGGFYYEDAILNITLNYGGSIITQYGGNIQNDCTYDPFFSILAPGPNFIELAQPSCLPGADQADLSNLDLTVLNDIISYPYPALTHPGGMIDNQLFSSFAHPFNFRLAPLGIPEPDSLILLILGIVTIMLLNRRRAHTERVS